MFDGKMFKEKIAEKQTTIGDLASELGINESTLYRKISGVTEFTRKEIHQIRVFLELTVEDTELIFFAQELA